MASRGKRSPREPRARKTTVAPVRLVSTIVRGGTLSRQCFLADSRCVCVAVAAQAGEDYGGGV
jgi:hypothetical protein